MGGSFSLNYSFRSRLKPILDSKADIANELKALKAELICYSTQKGYSIRSTCQAHREDALHIVSLEHSFSF